MIFWGYFFTACAYFLYGASRFCKTKQYMLLLDLLSKPFMAAGLYYFQSLSGSYIMLVICFMLIAANLKEHFKTKWLIGYLFFQSLYLLILYHTYIGFSSILITLCVSITLFCTWWLPPQKMRLICGFNCFISLAYHLSIRNWLGIFELISMTSNFSAYYNMKRKSKRKLKSI